MQNAQGITYLHGDHLGSTSVASNASGGEVGRQTYLAFGGVRATTGSVPTDFTFTGQKLDASDGLMYYGARYYDAALGRFISADTLVPNLYNPQNLNRYAYVRNNPVRYVDPTGYAQTCGQGELCGIEGTGTPPPAVTQNDQRPSGSDDACNLARCGGSDSSSNQTPLGQGPTSTPTPGVHVNPAPNACPVAPKFCRTPVSILSLGVIGGFFENFWAGGRDIVFDWETNEIGWFEWNGVSPNGFITPQAGISAQKGWAWGLNSVADYEGTFNVTGVTVVVPTTSVFSSQDGSIVGYEVGGSISVPRASLHSISADYKMYAYAQVPPTIMGILYEIPFIGR